jgi:hypothetical protein
MTEVPKHLANVTSPRQAHAYKSSIDPAWYGMLQLSTQYVCAFSRSYHRQQWQWREGGGTGKNASWPHKVEPMQ